MSDSTTACARGRAWPSSSRTQAAWRGSATRAAEDAEMRRARGRHPRVRGRGIAHLARRGPRCETSAALPVPPTPRADPPRECDLAVVGAGIVGLAAARELALRHDGLR